MHQGSRAAVDIGTSPLVRPDAEGKIVNMAVELFLHGFASVRATRPAIENRPEKVASAGSGEMKEQENRSSSAFVFMY